MLFRSMLPLTGVSLLALATGLAAQETGSTDALVLDPITLVSNGQENVEATGGVVVSQEDIEVLNPADVSELFARDSAISVSGGAGPSKRIHVFGMEQSNLAVTVDGVPQGVTSWHHTGSNVIDPAFLKSVEIEAGAAAADAGFGAAAGAVRYETLGAKDLLTEGRNQGGRVGLSYGSNGRGFAGSLAGYGVYEGFDWFAMIHSANGDNYENGDGDEMPGTAPATKGALTKLGYEFEGHRVELAYEYSEDEDDRVIKMNMDLDHSDEVFPLSVKRNTLSLKYTEVSPTDLWDPEAMIYISRNEYWRPNYLIARPTDERPRPFNGDMDLETQSIGGKFQNTYRLGSGTVTAGVDWQYDDYRVDNYDGGNLDNIPGYQNYTRRVWTAETMQLGAYAQGRFEFDNGIDVSTGLRLDHQRFTDWDNARFSDAGASANATVAYEFAPGYEVFAGGSHTWLGYQVGEFGMLHARDAFFYTDPDLEASTATNVKVGLNANQGNWTGNVTYFDTRLDGLASYFFPEDGSTAYLTNADEYRSKGFTLQGNYSWGSGRVGASLTKADVTQNGEEVLPQGGTVMPIGTMASLYVDQDIPQYNLRFGGTVEWANDLEGDYLTDAGISDHPSYTVVSAYAEWRPASYDNLVVNLNVDNLFNENYYERSSYVQNDDRLVYPLYAPGRTVTLGLKLDF